MNCDYVAFEGIDGSGKSSIIEQLSKILDENNINYNKPSRISKENSQFKEAQKLKAEYLINADEDTIKNLVTNDIKEFDIEVIREH